jgi:hypothetical protein
MFYVRSKNGHDLRANPPTNQPRSIPPSRRTIVYGAGTGLHASKPNKLWSQRSALDLLNSGQVNPLTPGTLDGKAQPMLSGGIPEGR